MKGPLAGRHAFVTGAGSGIGAAVARALAARGVRVSLAGRRVAKLEETAATLGALAGAIVPLDVTDADAVTRAVSTLDPIDILVNNAGRAISAPFAKTDPAMFDEMLAVNLRSVYLVTRAVLPAMIARGHGGRIINVASIAGLVGHAYVTAYVAAKHGVVGLTKALAAELVGTAITVNAVCPGYTDTPMVHDNAERVAHKTKLSAADAVSRMAESNPGGQMITPDEVAHTVVWLAEPGASAVNGQAIVVAGGAL